MAETVNTVVIPDGVAPPNPTGAGGKVEKIDDSKFQSLKTEAAQVVDEELRSFTVREGKPDEEKFRMRSTIAAAVLLDLAVVGDKGTPQVDQLRAMRMFLDEAVEPEDQPPLHQKLRRSEPPIEFEELGEIIEKMVEKISARPTAPQ